MLRTQARVPTPSANRYAKQLCSHFSHRVKAEWSPPTGFIEFPRGGTCHLQADTDGLLLIAEATVPELLDRIQVTVGGHLERFARRDGLEVTWE